MSILIGRLFTFPSVLIHYATFNFSGLWNPHLCGIRCFILLREQQLYAHLMFEIYGCLNTPEIPWFEWPFWWCTVVHFSDSTVSSVPKKLTPADVRCIVISISQYLFYLKDTHSYAFVGKTPEGAEIPWIWANFFGESQICLGFCYWVTHRVTC